MIGERIYSGSPYEEKAGYARAVVVDGWIFVSGTTGFDPDTKQFPEDIESQCENAFRNISRALAEAGATLDDLVRVLIFVTSQPEFERIMPIIRKHCYRKEALKFSRRSEVAARCVRVEIGKRISGRTKWQTKHHCKLDFSAIPGSLCST